MLDSSCANACALNGLPGPMRLWFTHSLTFFANRGIGNIQLAYQVGSGMHVRRAPPHNKAGTFMLALLF